MGACSQDSNIANVDSAHHSYHSVQKHVQISSHARQRVNKVATKLIPRVIKEDFKRFTA